MEVKINEILVDLGQPEQPIRSDRELLEEILQLNRANLRRLGVSGIANKAVVDLLENFIELHDSQETENGGYQEVLDILQKMSKAVNHISSRYKGTSQNIDELINRFEKLSFQTRSQSQESESEDDPF